MMIPHLLCLIFILTSGVFSINEEQVTGQLYSNVLLPCQFNFVTDLRGLSVIWEKEGNQIKLYKMEKEIEKPDDQDSSYRSRVELSKKFEYGNLDLILTNITYEDEGIYHCRAANYKSHGVKKVILSINDLNAHLPTATLVAIDGKWRWKCLGFGVYHFPQVQWITAGGEDLSEFGSQNVTEQSNSWKLVESILDHDVEPNVQVLCHIKEGRLKRSARAVMSDGHLISLEGEL